MKMNEYGRSMIEMLGVLAIIGVLTVGGIAGYTKAMNRYRLNETEKQITSIVANIRTLYLQQTSYNGLNNLSAVKSEIVPQEMVDKNSEGKLTNIFGGDVYIGSGNIGQGVSKIKNDPSFNTIYSDKEEAVKRYQRILDSFTDSFGEG